MRQLINVERRRILHPDIFNLILIFFFFNSTQLFTWIWREKLDMRDWFLVWILKIKIYNLWVEIGNKMKNDINNTLGDAIEMS